MKKEISIIILSILLVLFGFLTIKSLKNKPVVLDEVKLKDIEIGKKRTFAIMLQDEVGGTTYTESSSSSFPSSGYTFNSTKSGCMDANGEKIDNALSYDDETHKASVTTNKTSYCYLYFDIETPTSPFIELLGNKMTQYTGKVTDIYTDYGVGVDATKVYYMNDNDYSNVIFGGYCWKIIRTTETGGTKLLYNGVPVSGECTTQTGTGTMINSGTSYAYNSINTSPAYVGYMYNATSGSLNDMLYASDVNEIDSNLKSTIETWYASSGIDSSKLEDAVYCNDRSLASQSSSLDLDATWTSSINVYFASSDRTSASTATLACANITDAFSLGNTSAQTTYKVGFMTLDEAILVGSSIYGNGSVHYWLGSPNSVGWNNGNANVFEVFDGDWFSAIACNLYGVRPVISLSYDVSIASGGTGETTSPFVVS